MSSKVGKYELVVLDCKDEDLEDVKLEIPMLERSAHVEGIDSPLALVERNHLKRIRNRSQHPVPARLVGLGMTEVVAPSSWFREIEEGVETLLRLNKKVLDQFPIIERDTGYDLEGEEGGDENQT